MLKSKRVTIIILGFVAAIYFTLFIFPNLTGAQDPNMLSAFEHDEFAQYPHVIRMITPGDTLYQTVRNFVVYLHYYYGYPFYFFSALSILPVKLILGNVWAEHTSIIVMVLRQMINVLPIIASVFLLVWIQTGFKSRFKSIVLFILLLTVPAVVSNNMWWHPDSLLTLFSILTIFFLVRDDFKFGKNFFLSGIACGLAVGAKILGLLFVLTYAVYIIYGLITHRIRFIKAAYKSVLFLTILLGTVVITNPLLLLPMERKEIIAVFREQLQQNTVGFWVVGNTTVNMFTQIITIIKNNYSSLAFLLLSLATTIYGLFRRESRTICIVILSWTISFFSYFIIFSATMRPHYLIPAALPLFSSVAIFLPDFEQFKVNRAGIQSKSVKPSTVLLSIIALCALTQTGFNGYQGSISFNRTLNREQNSPSIQMFQQAELQVLSKITLDRKIQIYRDWRAYVAPRTKYNVFMNWDLANYAYIQQTNPDVIFVEYENMLYFSDASKIESAIDKGLMQEMVAFYTDAINGQIKGYDLTLKTNFGSVFVRNDLYQKYW